MNNKKLKITRATLLAIASLMVIGGCATTSDNQQAAQEEQAPAAVAVTTAENNIDELTVPVVQAPEKDAYDTAVESATDPLSPTRLVLVSRYGHDDIVKYLLDNRVDVNTRDANGYTALIAAAEGGHLNTVKMLLEANADTNASKPNGETALMGAASNGYVDVMRLLLEAQAQVNAKNNIGETALFNAVKYGQYEATNLLLSYEANPNLQNTDKVSALHSGFTPLMYAAGQGVVGNTVSDWDDLVELLLNKGARPNTRTERGDTALSMAKRRYDPRVISLLESAGARQERLYTSLSEEAALVKASRLGHVDKVKALLNSGTKANARLDNGLSPLLAASFENRVEVAQVLIKHGADVNDVPIGMRKWALTASASSLNDQELLKSASRGDTALLISVRRNHPELAKLLLSAKADPTLNNHEGEAPIFLAASVGNAGIIQALLDKGVDPNVLEAEKLTVSMTNTLQVMGRNTPLITAAQNGHNQAVHVLLEAGANVDHQGFLNKTALLWASERGYTSAVDLLLQAEADPNVNDVEGLTPLMVAARNGNAPIVKRLLAKEADPNKIEVPDVPGSGGKSFGNTGMTALIYAARGGHDEIVKQLIEAGSNVNAMSRRGETAMREASSHGYQEIVQLLKVSGAQEF